MVRLYRGSGQAAALASSCILFIASLELISVQFMFTDGRRVLDKSVAPDISNPIFYTTELDDNSNAVLVILHHIIPE